MDRTFLATVVAAVLLVAGGIGAGVYLSGTGAFDQRFRVDPAVTQFHASNATCVADPDGNLTVSKAVADNSTYLSFTRNVTVPSDDNTVANASLARVGLANYTLSMQSVVTGRDGEGCPAGTTPVVEVTGTVQVPHSREEPYRVTVVYDDEVIAVVRNQPSGVTVED